MSLRVRRDHRSPAPRATGGHLNEKLRTSVCSGAPGFLWMGTSVGSQESWPGAVVVHSASESVADGENGANWGASPFARFAWASAA